MLTNKKIITLIFFILWGSIIHNCLHSQTRNFFSTDNGLSNSLINQIYQDSKGFIWIATEYGLNKFDGSRFTIYKHSAEDTTSINHNYVRTVFEDSSGKFYIGTINGLMLYNRATDSFRKIKTYREGKLVNPHITSIIELHNGDIWLTTSGHGVFSCSKESSSFSAENLLTSSLNSIYLNYIYEDSKHNLWIGSENDGLNYYNPETKQIKIFKAPSDISSNNISAISEDSFGNVFIGTLTRGLNIYDNELKRFSAVKYDGNSQLFISSLLMTEQNELFIGTDGQGMKKYDRETNSIKDYDITSLPFNFTKGKIHSILLDRDGNTWLGFFQKGLIFIPTSENKFEYFGYKSLNNNPIGSSSVTSIFKDKEGITWIGTDNDGIYGINEEGERISHFYKTSSPYSAPNIIHSIYEDSFGNMWIGSYTDGLAKLNRKTGFCEYIERFSNQKVYFISEDNNKNLLIGTYGSGFFLLDNKGRELAHYESSKREMDILSVDELSNDWINTLLCDSEGLIWIGHFKGLSCFNPEKKTFLTYFRKNNILPGTVVQSLSEDNSGNIWIGTSSGLFRFNKKTQEFIGYTEKNGLPNNVICGICKDQDSNLWISTYQGISKFKINENRFINYFAADGLQGNEFSRGAAFESKDGRIFFGGINGVTSFYPENIIEEKKELNILLTNFYRYNEPVKQGDKSGSNIIINTSVLDSELFTLSYQDNTFSLEFSTLDYANPERISYQYMMTENNNSEWMNTSPGINRITYNNMAPGNYTFKVRAFENGNYSHVKTLKIIITPPLYRSWWAYCIYGILFVLILYLITGQILSRIRHKEELMEKDHAEKISEAKLQFFINISHEIRTPMTLIINPLEKLISENKDSEKKKIYLMIYRNAQRILRLINQLMDIRKLDKGQMILKCRETDIVGFINDLMLTFEYQAKKKNIKFSFEHTTDVLKAWIDLNNFDKVLLNIFSNAFKYTPENGEINISLSGGYDEHAEGYLKNYFEIAVSDTGIGIDKDQIERIFERFYQINNDQTNSNFGTGIGLHLSKLLVELHHGIIFAENREDCQGSRLVVRIPMGNSHFTADDLENPQTDLVEKLSSQAKDRSDIADYFEDIKDSDKNTKAKTKYKVLVVEDEEEIRLYIKDELSTEYKIIEARDGKEALTKLLKEKIDLVISDVMMPEMDGINLSRKIKQNININHIPIILLTAKSKTEDKLEGLVTGADAYIVKPFNTELLKQTIINLITNRERLKNKFNGNQEQNNKIQKIEIKSSDEILLEKVMKIINENLSNPDLNVEMLAGNIGMSRVHMHRKLKELTSQSARDFIKGIRLKQAASLLTGKKLSVSEVAYATGFSNLSHFSNSFKEFHGVSPSEYINNHTLTDKP